jgi:hypothetical protein
MDLTLIQPILDNLTLTTALVVAVLYFYKQNQDLKNEVKKLSTEHLVLIQKVARLEAKESLAEKLIKKLDSIESSVVGSSTLV